MLVVGAGKLGVGVTTGVGRGVGAGVLLSKGPGVSDGVVKFLPRFPNLKVVAGK